MRCKRLFDYALAGTALVAATPLFLLFGALIKLEDGGPVFFVQDRVGKKGKLFPCLKFRTMILNAEAQMLHWRETNAPEWQEYTTSNNKLVRDPRVTRVGQVLRRTSLDELPQLLNVLLGHMSVVGPRPLLEDELEQYGAARVEKYGQMLPGITGLWQVSGRSNTSFEMRAEFDMQYWANRSLWQDLAILARTVKVVLGKDGAY